MRAADLANVPAYYQSPPHRLASWLAGSKKQKEKNKQGGKSGKRNKSDQMAYYQSPPGRLASRLAGSKKAKRKGLTKWQKWPNGHL